MAIEDQVPPPLLEKLVQYFTNNHIPMVLACDTNAHHSDWGSADYNHRGIILSEYITTTNLEVANHGTEPTFCASNKRTVIDVTLVDKVLYRDIHQWHVLPDDTMSDHRQTCGSTPSECQKD